MPLLRVFIDYSPQYGQVSLARDVGDTVPYNTPAPIHGRGETSTL